VRSDSEILSSAFNLVKLLLFKIQAQTERNTENDYIRSICNLMKSELNYLPQQIKDTYENDIDSIHMISQDLLTSTDKESDVRGIKRHLRRIIPEVIYHYTSYENFYNILKTGQLHLSAPWNANDPLEGQLHHKGKEEGKTMRYFASLTSCFDSRLMSEAYGDKGRGVAIGFNSQKLKDVLAHEEKKWETVVQEKSNKDYEIQSGENVNSFGKILADFAYVDSLDYDPKSIDWSKAPFYAEENEIRLSVTNYWINFEYLEEKSIIPKIHTKFVNGKIVDYIPLNILQNCQLTEIIPEIILGPNFDNKNQISLNNFIQIQFNSSFEYQYLEPFLTNKPIWETPAEKLQIYVSRGNPKSISQYRESLKEKKSCASFQSSQSCSNARL
jgi:hypothetical protein